MKNSPPEQNVRTYLENNSKERTYVIGSIEILFPPRFLLFEADQMQDVFKELGKVAPELRQAVVDEWEARCQGGGIRRPVGYLFQIISKAQNNQFRVCAAYKQTEQIQKTPVRAKPISKEKRDDIVPLEKAIRFQVELRQTQAARGLALRDKARATSTYVSAKEVSQRLHKVLDQAKKSKTKHSSI